MRYLSFADFGNQLGSVNDGIVYSMADYEAECDNECSLKEGESIRVLRRGDEVESEWWWASKSSGSRSEEGYVPRSILSVSRFLQSSLCSRSYWCHF